jgi:hypothetical protein
MAKSKISIPAETKGEVQELIDIFNREHFNDKDCKELGIVGYSARYKGKYLYLDRDDLGKPSPICRLSWNEKMDNWGFAIYKYSDNCYDSEEWFFPGQQYVDGTVSGAMKAGIEAYQF